MSLLSREVGSGPSHRLELNEVAQALDLVEVNPDLLPKEQEALFCDHDFDLERAGQRCLQLIYPVDMHYPVTTLTLSGPIRALVRDQAGRLTLFLPELQAAVRYVKVSVALDQHATGIGT